MKKISIRNNTSRLITINDEKLKKVELLPGNSQVVICNSITKNNYFKLLLNENHISYVNYQGDQEDQNNLNSQE